MPANRRSLRITDLYGQRLKAVDRRVRNIARTRWGFQQGDFDAAYEQWLPTIATVVTEAQRENLRLTAGYLAAFITSETGRFTSPPVIDPGPWVGSSQSGRPFADAYRDSVVDAKVAISEGKTVEEASNIGLKTALTMVSLDTYEAARGPFHEVLPSISSVIGYRRVTNGETCGACLGLEDGTVIGSEDTFEIHPGCDCVGEPVIADVPDTVSRPTGTEKFRELPREVQDESIGIKAAEAVRNGDVTLADLAQTYRTETGPDFITQRPLSDVL